MMDIRDKVIEQLAEKLKPELLFTAINLTTKYGELMSAKQYAHLMGVKLGTIEKQISNETIPIEPVKFGRLNFFPTIEVAKMFHK